MKGDSVSREHFRVMIERRHPDWPRERVEWMIQRVEYWTDPERRERLFAAHTRED